MSFIEMLPAAHAHHVHPVQPAKDEFTGVACHRGSRESRKLRIRNYDGMFDQLRQATEPGAENHAKLRREFADALANTLSSLLGLIRRIG
ncbi:hypothetical protein D9M70_560470 [compost metagenome]